jgi:GrpB-like predicted nucleotidyltransferase (UPF0157 family)
MSEEVDSMPSPEPIILETGSVAWAAAFATVAEEIASRLGPAARIEHVGSTAVVGLAAKPVVDVLVGLPDARTFADAGPRLAAIGFKPGNAIHGSQASAFVHRPARPGSPATNVHLTVVGSEQWTDLVRFRDRLRSDHTLRRRYEALKSHLAASCGGDLDVYTEGKTAFVAEVLGLAHG